MLKNTLYCEVTLSDVNRSLITPEQKMRCHILSQGVFYDRCFHPNEDIEIPHHKYLHSYKVCTSYPNDYFYCVQKPSVWKNKEGCAVEGDSEYIIKDINPKYKKNLPKDSFVKCVDAWIEEIKDKDGEEITVLTPSPDAAIYIPVKDMILTIPLYGTSSLSNDTTVDVNISLIRDMPTIRRVISYIEAGLK